MRRRVLLAISFLIWEAVAPACSSNTDDAIELRLDNGADTATTTFDAEDPRTHTQTISIELEPADADVTLEFRTADEVTLNIHPNGDCESSSETRTCSVPFPLLEAREGGEWQAIAAKTSGPPATITFSIAWEQP